MRTLCGIVKSSVMVNINSVCGYSCFCKVSNHVKEFCQNGIMWFALNKTVYCLLCWLLSDSSVRASPGTKVKLIHHCMSRRFLPRLALKIDFVCLFAVLWDSLSTCNFQKLSLTVQKLLRISPKILLEKRMN